MSTKSVNTDAALTQQDDDNNDELFYKLGCFIDYATGGRLSKLNWPLATLKQSHDENLEALIAERIQEAEEDEQDADKVDAERYRWLRNPETAVGLALDKRTGFVEPDDSVPGVGGYHTYEYRSGEELDAAIDSAQQDAGMKDAQRPKPARPTPLGAMVLKYFELLDRAIELDKNPTAWVHRPKGSPQARMAVWQEAWAARREIMEFIGE